jgi:hypothetical protein
MQHLPATETERQWSKDVTSGKGKKVVDEATKTRE